MRHFTLITNFDCTINFPVVVGNPFSCDINQEDNQLALYDIVYYSSNVEQIVKRKPNQRQNNHAIT